MPVRPLSPSSGQFLVALLGQMYVLADDLPAEIHKDLVDICPPPRTRLVVGRVPPLLRQLVGAGSGDDPVFGEVGLVADDDDGHGRVVLDLDNLLAELGKLVQAVHVGDGEDEQEALALFHVQLTHGRELLGASRVQTVTTEGGGKKSVWQKNRGWREKSPHLEYTLATLAFGQRDGGWMAKAGRGGGYIDFDLLPVGVLNRGIVALNPDVLHELGGQATLSHPACPSVSGTAMGHRFCMTAGRDGPAPKTTMWYSRLNIVP